MNFKRLTALAVATVIGAGAFWATEPATARAEGEIFVPLLVFRTGPYAPNGIPVADAFQDYMKMLNERDGGINGVKLTFEECETQYNNDRGVECYERLKNNGPTGGAAVFPFSTGITYALLDRSAQDKIPILSMGYGRADASDGRVFPYVFTPPATYWGQADAMIHYIADEEGGYDNLKGKKIALVYHDSAYGKEPIKTLELLSKKYGFDFHLFPVSHPGLEQKSTWLQIGRRLRPDWTLMWGWGVMNSTAIKEAAAVGYPMDKFIGVWWSGSEPDVRPAGAAAKGYKSGTFNGVGQDYPVVQDILKHVYDKGNGTAESRDKVGEVGYNRGLINMLFVTEAIRTAMGKYGNRPLTGEEIRWGFENLDLSADVLKQAGFEGMMEPIKLSCEDHEGGGKLRIQQWDGEKWEAASDWIEPNQELIRELYKESAEQFAKEKGLPLDRCDS